MKNLKLTTLALLIPVGWLASEAAAYPEPVERIDNRQDSGPKLNCFHIPTSDPDVGATPGNSAVSQESFTALVEPYDTTRPHQERDNLADICRLDLNQFNNH